MLCGDEEGGLGDDTTQHDGSRDSDRHHPRRIPGTTAQVGEIARHGCRGCARGDTGGVRS